MKRQMVKLKHANTGETIYMNPQLFFCAYYSPTHKATFVEGGGAVVPVTQKPEEVADLVSEANLTNQVGDSHE